MNKPDTYSFLNKVFTKTITRKKCTTIMKLVRRRPQNCSMGHQSLPKELTTPHNVAVQVERRETEMRAANEQSEGGC
jgi:hypothetical protein